MDLNNLTLMARLDPDKMLVGGSWPRYKQIPVLELREIVALSVGLDPVFADAVFALTEADNVGGNVEMLLRFAERCVIAQANIEPFGALPVVERDNKPANCKVRLTDFALFADGMGWDLPEEFPRKAEAIPRLQNVCRLPWGNHETDLLRKLAAASDRFWKLYDPSDAGTAPTNRDVIDWLKTQGVADRNAEVMATILRADGLPTGPRK